MSTGGIGCEFAAGWKQGQDYDNLTTQRPQAGSLPVSRIMIVKGVKFASEDREMKPTKVVDQNNKFDWSL